MEATKQELIDLLRDYEQWSESFGRNRGKAFVRTYYDSLPDGSNLQSDWISIEDRLPERKEPTDVYTNCICGAKGHLAMNVVFYHHDQKFYYNYDTSHSQPIPATHWRELLTPPS